MPSMCVYMYVFVCVCVCLCVFVYIYMKKVTSIEFKNNFTYIYVKLFLNSIEVTFFILAKQHMGFQTMSSMCMFMCVCVYVCICVYICGFVCVCV